MTDLELAGAIQAACLDAARAAYEDAGIRGLCHDGRWEAAVSAVQSLDLEAVARQVTHDGYSSLRASVSDRESGSPLKEGVSDDRR